MRHPQPAADPQHARAGQALAAADRPATAIVGDIVERARRIGEDAAGPAAIDVDRDARFPIEAVDAMRDADLLSTLIPVGLGGTAASLADVRERSNRQMQFVLLRPGRTGG